MIARRALLAGAVGLAGCAPKLAKRFNGYCIVANRGSHSLAVVNLTRFKVDRHIALAGAPDALIVHRNLRAVLALLPEIGTVIEVPSGTLAISRTKKLAGRATSMRRAGGQLWMLAADPQALLPLNLQTWERGRQIALPYAVSDFDITQDGQAAVVSYAERSSCGLVDLQRGVVIEEIPLATRASVVRFRPDGKQVLAGSAAGRSITIADRSTGGVLVVLPMPFGPERFCFSTDNGGQLFTTGQGMDGVGIIYPYQTELAETVLTGRAPGAMTVNDTLLFVTNPEAGDVTVMAIAERQMVAKIESGTGPCAVALDPDGEYAMVLNRGSGDMAVVRLSKLTDLRYKRAPLFTVIAVGQEPVAAAVCRL